MARKEREAVQRVERAAARLGELGNPGLQTRTASIRVQGKKSLVDRIVGGSGVRTVTADAQPAWPIGVFQWEFRSGRYHKSLETGFTVAGDVVPMQHAVETDGIDDTPYRWRLGREPASTGNGTPLTTLDIALGLERVLGAL